MVRQTILKVFALAVLMLIVGANSSYISAQTENDEVTLVVSGEASTHDEAVKMALRSAVEQTFGTLVSSNTQILNDELIKDEIVTVSSGTIKKYEVLSEVMLDKKCCVLVKTTVSVNGLVTYAKSKGAKAELDGSTFAMNMKLNELYKKSELKAFNNLMEQVKELAPSMFDYKITTGSPKKAEYKEIPNQMADLIAFGGRKRLDEEDVRHYYEKVRIAKENCFICDAEITITANETFYVVLEMIRNTLKGLGMDETTVNLYRETKIDYECLQIQVPRDISSKKKKKEKSKEKGFRFIRLRNKGLMKEAIDILNQFLTSFEIRTDTYDDFCYKETYTDKIIGIHSSFENPLIKQYIYKANEVSIESTIKRTIKRFREDAFRPNETFGDRFNRIKKEEENRETVINWNTPAWLAWYEKRFPEWKIKGHLYFSLSELEKTKTIEVLSMTLQNMKNRDNYNVWPFR